MFHITKYERLASKMEGKTNFSRRLKWFDGLTSFASLPAFSRTLSSVHFRNVV